MQSFENDTVESLREQIDVINEQIVKLYMERIGYAERMAKVKHVLGLPVYDPQREKATLEAMCALVPEEDRPCVTRLFELLIKENRMRQEQILNAEGGEHR